MAQNSTWSDNLDCSVSSRWTRETPSLHPAPRLHFPPFDPVILCLGSIVLWKYGRMEVRKDMRNNAQTEQCVPGMYCTLFPDL